MTYRIARSVLRAVFALTIRVRVRGAERVGQAAAQGGCILACSHLGHLDALCLSVVLPAPVDWMARVEFYRHPAVAWLLRRLRAFPVDRRGSALGGIRTALARLAGGAVVGIFPEGEVMSGRGSVLRGAAVKRGVCLLAERSGRPVLPCVILGADRLDSPDPWLPARRGRLWVICGERLTFSTPPGAGRQPARAQFAVRLEAALAGLYAEARREWGLNDSVGP